MPVQGSPSLIKTAHNTTETEWFHVFSDGVCRCPPKKGNLLYLYLNMYTYSIHEIYILAMYINI